MTRHTPYPLEKLGSFSLSMKNRRPQVFSPKNGLPAIIVSTEKVGFLPDPRNFSVSYSVAFLHFTP
jgi:hypothetical protein